MRYSFRRFIEDATAAPAMGTAPSAPDAPDDNNTHNDSDVMRREFGISKKDYNNVSVNGEMLSSNYVLRNLPNQKFIMGGIIPVQVNKVLPDGSAQVSVKFSLGNAEKAVNLDGLTKYQGPIEDLDTRMSKMELDKLRLGALEKGAGAGGMPGGDPMGGGAPPGGMPGGAPPMEGFMTFKDFIMKETMTSTSSIAGFSRITLPLVTRMYPPSIDFQNNSPKGKKRKPVRQPQVKD